MTTKRPYGLLPVVITASLLIKGCSSGESQDILSLAVKDGNSHFEVSYDREFANRFSLPSDKIVSLPKGLKAVAAEIAQVNNRYQCKIHYYSDEQLEFYTPAEGSYYSSKHPSEYFFVGSYNQQDQKLNLQQLTQNRLRVLFRSTSLNTSENGIIFTADYDRIHKNFLPGLTVSSVNLICSNLEQQYHPAEIWIQRKDADNYVLGEDDLNQPAPSKNYRLPVPEQIIKNLQPYVKLAVEHNLNPG